MMAQEFVFDSEEDIVRDNDHVVRLPASIKTPGELFEAYYAQLELPGYFGDNWNALSDCLRDLSWLPQRRAVILHKDVPSLSETDLREYLDVLRQCIGDWQPDEDHELVVVFPADCRDTVMKLLKDSFSG